MRQGSHHLYDDIDRPKAEVGGAARETVLRENGTARDEDFD